MKVESPINTNDQRNQTAILPKILSRYQESDFGVQQRVIFFYRLCISIIVCLAIMIAYTGYVQILSPNYGKLFLPVLIPEFVIFFVVILILYLIIKGHFEISTHLLFTSTLATVWIVIFMDKGNLISRLDTVVFIFAILSALPLLVKKSKIAILVYTLANIVTLIAFVFFINKQLYLDKSSVVDYISDFTIAISFLGIVVYNISKINKRSLERTIKDIQERHEVEKALLESEKKYNETIEILPQTIFEADVDGKLTYVNKNGFETFGYTLEDFGKGLNIFSMIVESDRIAVKENIEKIRQGKKSIGNQYTALRKDGSTFPVNIYSKIVDINGKSIGFRGLIIDITEQAKAEEVLKQSEAFRQRIFDSSKIPIIVMDGTTLKIIDLNNAALNAYQFESREKIIGKSPLDLSSPTQYDGTPSLEKVNFYIKKAISEGFATFEWRHQRPNGELWDAEVHLLKFESNNQLLLQYSLIDITERKKAEKALRQSEELFRSLITNAPNTIVVTDLEGRYRIVNNSFEKDTGYSEAEVIGKKSEELGLLFDNESSSKNVNELASKGFIHNIETTLTGKNGSKINILLSANLVNLNGEPVILSSVINITERKKAERALKESQLLFQTLTQSSPVGIFRTRADGYTTFVNPKWSELSGLSFVEALGDGWLNAVHPDDRNKVKRNWDNDSGLGKTSIAEYRFLKPDGSIVWVLGDAVPEIIDGEVKGFIGTITDISEIKNAQGLLQTSEKRFRELADLLPQPVWETDSSGKVTYINNHGIELYGYSIEEFASGVNLLNTIIPEQRERAASNIKDRLIGKKVSYKDEEYISTKKNGETFPIQVYVTTIKENEKLVGLRGITFDMTEIKKAGEALKQSEEKYRTLMENMNEVVFMVNNEDKIQYVNKRFTEKLGYEYNEAIGKNGFELLYDKGDINKIDQATNRRIENKDYQYEIALISKNGNKINFLVSSAPLKNAYNDTLGSIVVLTDITEKKQIEIELEKYRNHLELLVKERTEELATTNEELMATNEELYNQRKELENTLKNLKETQNKLIQSEKMASLGVLAAGIAHEINNPLNFINGGASGIESYIKENFKDHLDEISPLIDGIHTGVKRAADIVSSLNHYSRRDDLPNTKCNANSIIDNCLVILHNQIKNRIEVVKDYSNKSYALMCNEGRLHQVFLNILSNAIQSIEDKGIITIFTNTNNNHLTITISDTGCGISKENLPRITDPFFTTKEPGKGTGLGLSITYSIIKDYNGTLEFESEFGVGTKVIVTLPLIKEG